MQSAEIDENGFGILENVLDAETVLCLINDLANLKPSDLVSRKNESVYGVRNLLNLSPKVREFSNSETVANITKNFLGKKAKVVRAIFLIKLPTRIGKCRGIRI